MKKIIILCFQILTALIIILLAFATFFIQKDDPGTYSNNIFIKYTSLDHFYHSYINIFLFSFMGLLIIISIIVGVLKRRIQTILHIIIALFFIIIIFDKSFNSRITVSLREGSSYQLNELVGSNNDKYKLSLFLNNFKIVNHPNSNMPKAFKSEIVIDQEDTVVIEVNKPLKIGKYRLYQNAYETTFLYEIQIDSNRYNIFSGDTIDVLGKNFYINVMDPDYNKIAIGYDSEVKIINANGGEIHFSNIIANVKFLKNKYKSTIEIAETTGMRLLLLLGLGYVVVLGIVFWRKKS